MSFAIKIIGSGVEAESFGPNGPLRLGLHGCAERTLYLDLASVQALVDFAVGVGYASTGKQPTGDASGDPSCDGADIGYDITVTIEGRDVRLTTERGSSIWLNEAAFKTLVRYCRRRRGWKTI